MVKRLAIFVFYDKDGIVDGYAEYLLQELKKCVTDLAIVVNGKVDSQGKGKLTQLSDWLFIRENKGFDAMAYKLAMADYLGWGKIMQYDEVLLTNDTYYGPVYPFQDVFRHMQQKQVDFWGLTCHRESADYFSYYQKITPAYIQSFFCVFRKPVTHSGQFQEYWNQFDSTGWIFSDVINLHEKVFTKKLEDMGFTWDTYIKEPLFESEIPQQNFIQYHYISFQLLKNHKCPIIKRKNFIRKHLTESHGGTGEDIVRALRYIEENTAYDTDMIWANLLRLYDVADIQKTLNLNYILQGSRQGWAGAACYGVLQNGKVQGSQLPGRLGDAAAVVWLSHRCCLDECSEYLKGIGSVMDVFLLSGSKALLQDIQERLKGVNVQAEIILEQKLEKAYTIFLKKVQEIGGQYRYFVFLQDVDFEHAKGSKLEAYSVFRHIWSNLADGSNYIWEVYQLFERNPRLGLLTLPQMVTGTAFGTFGNQWDGTLERVGHLLKELGIRRTISDNTSCMNGFSSFWCHFDIFKVYISYLIKSNYDNGEVIRSYPYMAQASGYYTGTVMNDTSAAVMYTNMQELLSGILNKVRIKYKFCDFDGYLDGDVLLYCKGYERVMVYGAGENGYRMACLLKKNGVVFDGYIVSDGQPNAGEKYGDKLINVSSLPVNTGRLGIVVSVTSTKFQAEIAENLRRQGYGDVYIL